MLPKDHRRLRGFHVVPGDDATPTSVSDPGQSWVFSILVICGLLAAAVFVVGVVVWRLTGWFAGPLVIGGAVVAAATLFPAGKWYFAWLNRPQPKSEDHRTYYRQL
jgi:hypothetical protein